MEHTWNDLAAHAPPGPVRDALKWVAAAIDAPGPLPPAQLDDRLRLVIFRGRQALDRLEELRRLRRPFQLAGVEAQSPHAADLRFLTAGDQMCSCTARLRLDWIGPEEIPLTDWDQVPDLLAHYRVPALSVDP